jgi:hypothetical protein
MRLMHEEPSPVQRERQDDLEARMQKISLWVSLLAMGLMVAGFVGMLLGGLPDSLPGGSVLPLPALAHPTHAGAPASLMAMSAGIVLLALLPTLRVVLALVLYARRRGFLNAVVALVVLLELITSMGSGG